MALNSRAGGEPDLERSDPSARGEARQAALGAGVSPASAERLSLFTAKQIANVRRRLTEPVAREWPEVDGFLTLLFTPRCGSTFLARELVRRFDIGKVGESFNPPRLTGRTAAEVIEARKGAWFATKLQTQGLICAELTGAIDRYLGQMTFIFLLRRDVIAQAISLSKAKQQQRFHSTGAPRKADVAYNPTQIGNNVRAIVHATRNFDVMIGMTGRPAHRFHYEDSADGNLGRLETVCDELGIPRAETQVGRNFAELAPIRDSLNVEWGERFRAEAPDNVKAALEAYQALL